MKAFKSVLIIACVLLAVLIIRALLHTPTLQIAADPVEISLDQELLVSHLAESIQFPTISYGTLKSRNSQAFEGFQTWVSQTYQHLHHRLELTKFNDTLLYLWQGSDPTLQPILLTGHYDVVPVIPGTEKQWKQPPFSGNIEGGYVWGRGALDDKSGVVGILEAVNYLLAQDFQPKRSIYLSFGH